MKKSLLFFSLFLSYFQVFSQYWTNYKVITAIRSIAVDDFGNKWAGTNGAGVSKYDGVSWRNYNVANNGLTSNYIYCITPDQQGNIWIGTNNGITKLTGNIPTNFTTSNSGLIDNNVTGIAIDPLGNKWISTNNGISEFTGTAWVKFNKTNTTALKTNVITCVAIDKQGNKWFGTTGYGVYKFDGATWTRYTDFTNVNSITIDSQGNIWVGGSSAVVKYDHTSFASVKYSAGSGGAFGGIAVDTDGILWAASASSGLEKLSGTTWTSYQLTANAYNAVALDNQGNKWIATNGGVFKYDDVKWSYFMTVNAGIADLPLSISVDTKGNKWITTNAGVAKLNGDTWTNYTSTNSGLGGSAQSLAFAGYAADWILSTSVDRDGNPWFGKYFGLCKFDGSNWTNYDYFNTGASLGPINCVAIDGNGNKWLGTNLGPYEFNDTAFINNSTVTYLVNAIAIDTAGNKWLATNSGAVRFNAINKTEYNKGNSNIPSNTVKGVAIDILGNQWFATDSGVSVLSGNTFTNYNPGNSGLTTKTINCVVIDMQGNKWFGTSSGVFKLTEAMQWIHYTTDSGLINNTVNCIAIDSSGNKWFGTAGGLSEYSDRIQYSGYVFTGTGDWDTASNWNNKMVPPLTVPSGVQVIINPQPGGECFLNKGENFFRGSTLTVSNNAKFRISGNIIVNNDTAVLQLAPVITSYSPDKGPAGTMLTISGANLSGASVTVDSKPAVVVSASTNAIVCIIPDSATTGTIAVTTNYGAATVSPFVAPPIISSFSPENGTVGTSVTITGLNLAGASVRFNNVAAVVTATSPTSITCTVPVGAVSGNIRVNTDIGTVVSDSVFTVL